MENLSRSLDIKEFLNEYFVPDVIERHRHARWFSSVFGISEELEATISHDKLKELFIAGNNSIFLNYCLTMRSEPERPVYSPEMVKSLKRSSFGRAMLEDDEPVNKIIGTQSDFNELLAGILKVEECLRKNIPRKYDEDPIYKANLSAIQKSTPIGIIHRMGLPNFAANAVMKSLCSA